MVLREKDRLDYSTIDVTYLRTLEPLTDWLRRNKRVGARIKPFDAVGGFRWARPGHPKCFTFHPDTRTLADLNIMADPDNVSDAYLDYRKENKYVIEVSDYTREYHPGQEYNVYYVVPSFAYKKLWNPLPADHVRMKVWELHFYLGYNNSYMTPDGEEFIYPPRELWDLKMYGVHTDERFKDEINAQIVADYEIKLAAKRAAYDEKYKQYATLDRRTPVVHIRKFIKDYQPNMELLDGDPHTSPYYPLLGNYAWYYCYASLPDMQNDPIFQSKYKVKS